MRRLAVVVVAVTVALAAPPAARAGWFGAVPVDTGVTAFGGVDVARDGTGAMTYVKADGHVWLSRLVAGAFGPAVRVDAGEPPGASDPVVAVADGGALVVAWRSGDRVLGAWGAGGGPLSAPVVLGAGDVGPPDVDMAVQATGFVVFRQGGDVRAVRLRGGGWQAVPGVLDVDPAQPAGAGAGRPRVTLDAAGNALVAWSERPAGGRARLYARRVTDLRLSVVPQEVGVADGGDADSASVASEWDGSFVWVAFRQDVGGTSRTIARRLVGSVFEGPAVLDRAPGSRAPVVSVSGTGAGLAVLQQDAGDVVVSQLERDVFAPSASLGAGAAPVAAGAESRDALVAWRTGDGFVGRHAAAGAPFEPAVPLGAGDGPAGLAADRAGDAVLGFRQGDRVVAAVWDELPGAASLRTNRGWKPIVRPRLRWASGRDLWGPLTHRVLVDGQVVATTAAEAVRAPRLAEGKHAWQVVSIDRRGQQTASRPRPVRVDTRGPVVTSRLRGRVLRVGVTDAGAGVSTVSATFGDGARSATVAPVHRYARAGRFVVVVTAVDRLGQVTRRRLHVRVR